MAFTVVATEDHVFSVDDPADYTSYLVPGNGRPAVSTSSYYNLLGLYNMRCYDLDTMGAPGAAVKAANGGKRYAWVTSADHPNISYGWRGQDVTVAGFSYQPWDFPKSMYEIVKHNNSWSTTAHPAAYQFYEFPYLFYNPDDPDGQWFYCFAETGPDHFTGLFRSADFITWTPKEVSHFHVAGSWSSFLSYVKRLGAGSYQSIAFSTVGGTAGRPHFSIWTSADAVTWASTNVQIFGSDELAGDGAGTLYKWSEIFTVAGQTYAIGKEEPVNGGVGSQYGTIFPIDAATFDKLSSPAKVRVTTKPFYRTTAGKTVGWEYLQEVPAFYEDGLLYTWPTYGFPSDVNTAALSSGRAGVPYANGGGLDQQFLDKMVVRVDDTLAAAAAPVGVAVSCNAGVVTITWKDALPANTYRIYRGTTAATQTTLVGNVTGTTITDSPTTNTRYWYKVVTLQSGTERKSRVLPVYVSSASSFINEHIDRVLDDGGDIATVNIPYLKRVDTMLTSVGIRNTLEFFTHPAFGMKSGATLKIYDVGCTRLPRGEDFKALTANTTYNATGVNGGPCWVNATNTAYGHWGNTKRGNAIHRKRQITIIAAYLRTQTTEDFTFVGTGPIWSNVSDGTRIIKLTHKAGTPGTIEFSLSDETGSLQGPPHTGTSSTKTASVTANGSGLQIAIGTYDGSSMKAYSNTTVGTAITALAPNPDFGINATWVEGSLAGARLNDSNGNYGDNVTVGGVGAKQIFPFLCSGSIHAYSRRHAGFTSPDDNIFGETHAKGSIQCVMILEGAINATQVGQIVSFLNEQVTITVNSKNFVTDFGAVGDGQVATTTVSVAGNVLTSSTPIFAAGDVGKTLSIYVASPHYLAVTPITVFTSATQVTLSSAAALSSSVAQVKWGTDNTAKLNGPTGSWRAWAQTQTDPANPPVLLIPDGHYCIQANATAGQGFNHNVPNPRWSGLSGTAASCTLSNLYTDGECRFGTDPAIALKGLDDAGANSVRLQTAAAGQTYVDLVNPAGHGSRIAVNRWCVIGGYDTQSGGYPPNNHFYEWNYITGYSAGRVQLLNPLTQIYKSTWPALTGTAGQQTDYGGPATLWVTPAGYDNTVELTDFTLLAVNGSSVLVRDVILRRMNMIGYGIYPTQCKSFLAENCSYPQSLEVDKFIDTMTFNNCTFTRNHQQSSSPNRAIFNGGTINTLGTAKYTEANNVTFTGVTPQLQIGVFYGYGSQLVLNNCSLNDAILNISTTPITSFTNYSWSGGLLRYAKAGGNLIGQFAPGAWVSFNGNRYIDKVVDVTADATYVYFQFARTTDWPINPPTSMVQHPMPDMTVRGCTGTGIVELQDWNAAPANWPFRGYAKRTYVAGASTANLPGAEWPVVWGRPTIKHTVTGLFTGGTALGFKVNLSGNLSFIKESDMSTVANFTSYIDMKIAGVRTMTNAAAPTGTVGTDAQYNFTSVGSAWFYTAANSSPGFTTSAGSNTWVPVTNGDAPTVTVEWMMDQGLEVQISDTRDPISGPIGLRLKGT